MSTIGRGRETFIDHVLMVCESWVYSLDPEKLQSAELCWSHTLVEDFSVQLEHSESGAYHVLHPSEAAA
jgi:hypothetical protein